MMPAQKLIFITATLFLFIFLYLFRLSQVPVYHLPEDMPVKLIGRVSQQPYHKGSQQIIFLGPVVVRTERFPGYFYGQKLQVFGKFEKEVINPFQVQYSAYFPEIQPIQNNEVKGKNLNLRTILINFRGQIEQRIAQLLPEPQSSLLLGILFGIKRQMPQKFWQNLRETGTLHIVVASGQNVTILARFLIGSLILMVSRRKALALAILGVFFYILMVGAEAPVVRAGIMAILAYVAQALGREEEGTIALFLAAAIMLLMSPLILFDIGFQLSFAATAGILWLYPLMSEKVGKVFKIPILAESLAMTLAAQLGVMPILLTNFGQISLLSPLINALVLWTVPQVMALGFILALSSLFISPLALVLSWFVWLFLTYFVKVISLAGGVPWISLEIGQLSSWWGIGYYLVLGYFVWRSRRRTLWELNDERN